MEGDLVHTVCVSGVWLVDIEGAGVISRHETKAAAVIAGRALAKARWAEHLIHDIVGRTNYGIGGG
jgi:hypothetical protein